jgi:hypothetical protein
VYFMLDRTSDVGLATDWQIGNNTGGICCFHVPGRRGTETAGSLQSLVYICRNTRCHIPKGITVIIYLPQNLKM